MATRATLTDAVPGEDVADEKAPPHLLLNPEVSRISFDERILDFASNPSVPLLERLRFLGMVGDRLDDFFGSRVARFKRLLASGEDERTIDGLNASEQLELIESRARRLMTDAYALLDELLPELEAQGIHIERWATLSPEDRESVWRTYCARIEALVKPLVADPTRPFPHIRNLRPALAVMGREKSSGKSRFIAIELPGDLPRFLPIADDPRFVLLEDAIQASLPRLYPGLLVEHAFLFRVTRSAIMEFDDDPVDILRAVERSVQRRPFQEVVRLECEREMPGEMRQRLLRVFQQEAEDQCAIGEGDIYEVGRPLDLAALQDLTSLERPELKFPPLRKRERVKADRGMLEHARRRDLLLQFPYDNFVESVERFVNEAADDPAVVRIAITLYRTGRDSAIANALCNAREKGKHVTAVVELKASFDEEANITWARDLERQGIHVILSPTRFKVHAKIGLIVRREAEGLRSVAYVGTGNMHASTARSYVDFGLLTADPELTREVNAVFELLAGHIESAEFNRLLVAPFHMRDRFLALINREIEHARAGRPNGIRIHINGLADRRCIGALYQASQAGVRIEMMVRDICALRPGVEGISDNITVVTVVGRLLHHARIFHFRNGGEDEYFIGSADWRPRNFNERVEVVAQIRQPDHQAELDAFLTGTLTAGRAWRLQSDGEYVRVADEKERQATS